MKGLVPGLLLLSISAAVHNAAAQTVRSPSDLFINQNWHPPGDQRCAVTRDKPLPPLETVFDSSAVARAATALGPSAIVASFQVFPIDSAVFARDSVSIDSVAIVETTLADEARSEMHRVLHSSLRAGAHASFLLRIDVDSAARFRTAFSLECLPAQVDREHAIQAMQNLASHGYHGRALVHLAIDVEGVPRAVAIERSSGEARLDHWLVVLVQGTTWYPALVNRVPVRVGVDFPLNIH